MNEPPRAEPESALRQAYRELQHPGSERCPESETLAAMALQELSGAERETIADHVVSCRRCSQDYQILARTHAEVSPVGRPLNARGWIAAAAVVCALAAGLLIARRNREGSEVLRGSSAPIGSLVVPSEGASLPAAPTEFVWPAQDRAESYRVQLFGASGERLWESQPTREPRAKLSESARAILQRGQSYYWVVEVEPPLEKKRLGPFPFTLLPG